MTYVGDFALGKTFDLKFTTVNTSGVPATLAGSPTIAAYVDNSITEITAGLTLNVDFDGQTGLNNVRVVATSGNGYASGGNYQIVVTAGTVAGASVVGYVVGQFSIEARSAVRPTVADRTLDVSATGEAGIDWANVGAPTSSLTLSGTTVGTLTTVGTGGITATSFAANAIDASALATNAAQEIADALLDRAAAIDTYTVREVLRVFAAALAGKASGMATTTAVLRAIDDSKTRITATVDANGNRSAVTVDAT